MKAIKGKMQRKKREEHKERWREMLVYGQILKKVKQEAIDGSLSWQWLTHANFKVETEILVTACQEQNNCHKLHGVKDHEVWQRPKL